MLKNSGKYTLIPILICMMYFVSCSHESTVSNPELLRKAVKSAENAYWRKTEKLAHQAVKKNPRDANAQILLALAYEFNDKPQAALSSIKKASELDEKNFTAQYNCGRILLSHQRYDDAVSPLKKACRLKPSNKDSFAMLAECYSKLKHPKTLKIYTYLAKSSRYKNNPVPYNEIAFVLIEKNKAETALKFFKKAAKLAPNNPITVMNIARVYDYYLEDPQSAVENYKEYLDMTEGNAYLNKERLKVQERIEQINI